MWVWTLIIQFTLPVNIRSTKMKVDITWYTDKFHFHMINYMHIRCVDGHKILCLKHNFIRIKIYTSYWQIIHNILFEWITIEDKYFNIVHVWKWNVYILCPNGLYVELENVIIYDVMCARISKEWVNVINGLTHF